MIKKKIHPGLMGITRYARTMKVKKWLKGNVLDVGCSDGVLLSVYKNIEGIEPDKAMFKEAKKWGKVKNASGENIPYPDNHFYTVSCIEVLEHVNDIDKTLNEISRVSKKRIILSFPMKPFKSHPEFIKKIPKIPGFKIIHKSYNFAPFTVPFRKDYFNNEKHMKFVKDKFWMKMIRFFRPLIIFVLYVNGNLVKTAPFLVYEKN